MALGGGVPPAGPGNDRHAKLAARLRYAPPGGQLGGAIVNALTFELDQSVGAGHTEAAGERGGAIATARRGRSRDYCIEREGEGSAPRPLAADGPGYDRHTTGPVSRRPEPIRAGSSPSPALARPERGSRVT